MKKKTDPRTRPESPRLDGDDEDGRLEDVGWIGGDLPADDEDSEEEFDDRWLEAEEWRSAARRRRGDEEEDEFEDDDRSRHRSARRPFHLGRGGEWE